MTHFRLRLTALSVALLSCLAPSAQATNGMDLEGYGPIALGMGGASFAYDNGLAAMMNNPATLGLMPQGNQIGVALHYLGPSVSAHYGTATADSGGKAYYMPAIGWVRKNGAFAYGVGMYAQGGMGTEYSGDSFVAMGTGEPVRSELGVGRILFPLAYEVTPKLTLGGTLDLVWAGLDMKGAFGPGGPRIDFSDNSSFTGAAKGYGYAGKLGLVYKAAPTLNVGLTYHTRTMLGDLQTDDNGAVFNGLVGKATVHDFQWPTTYGIGVAWQATQDLMLATDLKRIGWKESMQNYNLAFTPAGGSEIPLTMAQNWDNQNVFSLGAQYRVNDRLNVRAGYNYGKNPVPAATLNPLFPAIVEKHYTMGFDYRIGQADGVAMAISYAPEVSMTNGSGIVMTHSQLSGMLSYGHGF
jgi:long-chain fatty acid transport protein